MMQPTAHWWTVARWPTQKNSNLHINTLPSYTRVDYDEIEERPLFPTDNVQLLA